MSGQSVNNESWVDVDKSLCLLVAARPHKHLVKPCYRFEMMHDFATIVQYIASFIPQKLILADSIDET